MRKLFPALAAALLGAFSLGSPALHRLNAATGPQVKRGKKSSRSRFGRRSGASVKGIRSTFNTEFGRNLKAKFDRVNCTSERAEMHKAYLAHQAARKSSRVGAPQRLAA